MEKQRTIAIMNDHKLYDTGKPCRRGHISMRYTTSGTCRECQRQASAVQAMELAQAKGPKKERIALRIRQQACLQRGGPRTQAEATAHGLDWWVCPNYCTGVIRVDQPCKWCAEDAKQRLELAVQRMLE